MIFESLTFFFTFVTTLILLRFYIKISETINISDKPTNYNMHDRNVITGSGITFIIIYILSLFVLLFLEKFSFVKLEYPNRFYILNFVLVFFSLMSFYDDLKNLHPNIRFFVQLLLVSLSIPLINTEFLNTYFPLKIIIFFLVFYWVYLINIINFIDGLDGFLIFYCIFYFFNSLLYFYYLDIGNFFYFLSIVLFSISISFFIFNKPPAKIFMGDSGSIFLGYIIGLYSLYFLSINRIDIMITLICYPFMDCSLTIIRKMLDGKYPWERLFDYNFLKPVKLYNKSHSYVLKYFIIYNLGLTINLSLQIFYELKYFFILSIVYTLILINFYNKK
tara:strand:- start:371 stop:1369 length:999 start_codon:yes stop_codon:yes gene_type:complete